MSVELHNDGQGPLRLRNVAPDVSWCTAVASGSMDVSARASVPAGGSLRLRLRFLSRAGAPTLPHSNSSRHCPPRSCPAAPHSRCARRWWAYIVGERLGVVVAVAAPMAGGTHSGCLVIQSDSAGRHTARIPLSLHVIAPKVCMYAAPGIY